MQPFTLCLFVILLLFHSIIAWKAILDRHEVLNVNENYFKLNKVQIYKYNRTTKAGNIDFDLKLDLPLSTMIEFKIFGLLSNQYRELPLIITRKVCDILQLEYQWIKHEVNGHFVENCPITKDRYYVKDYVPNVSRFPKKPWNINNYKLKGKIYNKNEIFVEFAVYVITTDDDEYSV